MIFQTYVISTEQETSTSITNCDIKNKERKNKGGTNTLKLGIKQQSQDEQKC